MSEEGLVFLFFFSVFVSFVVSIVILFLYWSDNKSRLVGFYSLKPSIAYLFGIALPILAGPSWFTWNRLYLVYFVLEILLALLIVILYKDLYTKSYRVSWVVLFLDFCRWGALVLLNIYADFLISRNIHLDRNMYRAAISGIITCSVLYSLFGLYYGNTQYRKQ